MVGVVWAAVAATVVTQNSSAASRWRRPRPTGGGDAGVAVAGVEVGDRSIVLMRISTAAGGGTHRPGNPAAVRSTRPFGLAPFQSGVRFSAKPAGPRRILGPHHPATAGSGRCWPLRRRVLEAPARPASTPAPTWVTPPGSAPPGGRSSLTLGHDLVHEAELLTLGGADPPAGEDHAQRLLGADGAGRRWTPPARRPGRPAPPAGRSAFSAATMMCRRGRSEPAAMSPVDGGDDRLGEVVVGGDAGEAAGRLAAAVTATGRYLRSLPALNARLAPVMMATHSSGSAANSSNTSDSSALPGGCSALGTSGRRS